MSAIKNRILLFLEKLKVSQSAFEKDTKLSNGLINNLSDNISSKSLIKIKEKYPEFNIEWLLTGEGEMLHKQPVHVKDISFQELTNQNEERLIRIENYCAVAFEQIANIISDKTGRLSSSIRTELEEVVAKASELQLNELKRK